MVRSGLELNHYRLREDGVISKRAFYPRLSGTLLNHDSSPKAERLYVRRAIKAKRPLMNGLKDKLEAVNNLSTVHSRIFNVFDETRNRFDVLAAGGILSVSGYDIPVDTTKKDESVWLERRAYKGYVQVTKGWIVSSSPTILEIVFDDPIAIGKHVIAL